MDETSRNKVVKCFSEALFAVFIRALELRKMWLKYICYVGQCILYTYLSELSDRSTKPAKFPVCEVEFLHFFFKSLQRYFP